MCLNGSFNMELMTIISKHFIKSEVGAMGCSSFRQVVFFLGGGGTIVMDLKCDRGGVAVGMIQTQKRATLPKV